MISGNQQPAAAPGHAPTNVARRAIRSAWRQGTGPRLALAAAVTALLGAVYGGTNHWMAWRGVTVWDASTLLRLADGQTLDRWLPFVPWSIVLYTTLLAWYFVPAVTVPAGRERDFATLYRGLLLLSAVALAFFLLLPTEVRLRDQVWAGLAVPGVSAWVVTMYRGLHLLDCPFNSWPCLHTAQPLLIQLTLAHWHRQTHRLATAAGWVWWVLLTVSILTTKQHYLWDVATGIALALGTWYGYLRPRLALPSVGRVAAVAAAGTMALAYSPSASAAEEPPAIVGIRAFPERLVLRVTGSATAVRITEMQPYERDAADRAGARVWEGALATGEIPIPRFASGRDRLYSKFQLVDSATQRALGPLHWADDLAALPAWNQPLPWPAGIKGVSCPVDLEDLKTLGVKYTDFGVVLAGLFDWTGAPPAETWEVDGQKLPINVHYIRDLDRQIKRMTDLGINVTLIPVNGVPAQPAPTNPLINPHTDLPGTPNHIGAFNLTDERGLRYYRAAFEYLAHRYSDPAGEHGWVSGYVVGNEVQSHWYWHNSGLARAEDVARDYADMLRVAWLAVRRFHSTVRVYASLDHFWTARADANPLKSMPGRELLERLNAQIAAEGNFPWHVAFHPYPENLFEPRFWNDQTAGLSSDSPRVTFKNLEVLPAFLAQERFLFQGRSRRIILSEQGFNCPDGDAGETVQAAAFAGAYHKVSHMPAIDAFILHRHVDHRDEGGLHMGMWTRKLAGDDPSAPDRRRLIHEVFRLADGERWQDAFEFAKPVIGIRDWQEMLPTTTPIPDDAGLFARPLPQDTVVHSLLEQSDAVRVTHSLDWRQAWAKGADGRLYPALFHHPPDPKLGAGAAAFDLPLPTGQAGRRLVLRFGTVVNGPTHDGVKMTIAIADHELWSETLRQANQPADYVVDLSGFAGQTVTLTLRVDALGDHTGDWANWLRPVILVEPTTDGPQP